MEKKLTLLLNHILKTPDIYFYTIDNLFKKIVIFSGKYILDVSLVNRGGSIKHGEKFFFYLRKFDDINNIYKFVNNSPENESNNISNIINSFLSNEELIHELFINENKAFFDTTFDTVDSNKKALLILKGGGMEETIEKSFISYCNNSNIELTVLYRFGKGYWGQQLNQDGFFNELKANNTNVTFLYNEDFDDNYIDSLITEDMDVFSFQYDYKGKHKKLNLIVLSSVCDTEIDCSRYKNIFSCYKSKHIGYSSDKFVNVDNSEIYKIFNPQNIDLLNNFVSPNQLHHYILSGGMSWARDFSILNSLEGSHKGILISDENHDVKNFLLMYRGIQSYHGFLGIMKLAQIGIFCHLEEFNDDDRSKMIATSICSGVPVVVPHNDGLIVKEILDNNLGVSYKNGDKKDFLEKVNFFIKNDKNISMYSSNCKKYSEQKMDINRFMNFIFSKSI